MFQFQVYLEKTCKIDVQKPNDQKKFSKVKTPLDKTSLKKVLQKFKKLFTWVSSFPLSYPQSGSLSMNFLVRSWQDLAKILEQSWLRACHGTHFASKLRV